MMILGEHKNVHKYAALGFGCLHGLNIYQVSEKTFIFYLYTAIVANSTKFEPAFHFWGP